MKTKVIISMMIGILFTFCSKDDDNENNENEGENSIENVFIDNSPWDWNEYGEHAIFTFKKNGVLEYLWEKDSVGSGEFYPLATDCWQIKDESFLDYLDDCSGEVYFEIIEITNDYIKISDDGEIQEFYSIKE